MPHSGAVLPDRLSPGILNGLVNGITIGLAACLCVFVLHSAYTAYTGPLASIPGTLISKWTDLPVRLRILTGTRAQYVHALHQKYGPVVRLGPTEADVSDVAAAREIHRVRVPFTKSGFYGPRGARFQSMFSTRDPDFHAKRRRLLGSYFADASLTRLEPEVSELVRMAVDGIVEESRRSGCVDVLKWWTLMAMDVITTLSFGESLDLVRNGKKTQFAEDVARLGGTLPLRTSFPTLFALGTYVPFLPILRDMGQARQRIIAEQMGRSTRYMALVEKDESQRQKTIFGALVRKEIGSGSTQEQQEQQNLSPMDLVVEVQSFITAGTDTTAVTLTYLIWSVCRDRALQRALVTELQTLEEPLSNAKLRDLTLLNLVIDEALRCYGAAQGALPRDVPRGGLSAAGFFIPPKVVVSTQSYSLHRDAEVFADPEKFDPYRWETPTEQMQQAFMPFGIGPRGCIGAQLARMELRLATAMFFRAAPEARISAKEGMSDADMRPEISFLLMPAGHRCLVEVA